jgi:hypothetical protein
LGDRTQDKVELLAKENTIVIREKDGPVRKIRLQ